jgi:hypothetical protein
MSDNHDSIVVAVRNASTQLHGSHAFYNSLEQHPRTTELSLATLRICYNRKLRILSGQVMD